MTLLLTLVGFIFGRLALFLILFGVGKKKKTTKTFLFNNNRVKNVFFRY